MGVIGVMSLVIENNQVTITNEDPKSIVTFRYIEKSGRVILGTPDQAGTLVDMEMLINALTTIKTTEDNKRVRAR